MMSWCSDSSLNDIQAQQLSDQVLAASEDNSPESIRTFEELTTMALLPMTDEQWQELSKKVHEKF